MWYSGASEQDELQLEMIGAVVNRALVKTTLETSVKDFVKSEDWLIYSTSLWLKCKTEFHRCKTQHR
jgi:hypothetical protein